MREALRAGTRPLQRVLVLRPDRQFHDLIQLAKARGVPVHIEPPQVFERLVPEGHHQGIVAFVAAKSYSSTEQTWQGEARNEPPFLCSRRR